MTTEAIAQVLKQNGIIVYPTDTLYGILGSAFSKDVIEKIYDIKGRDEHKPFIILISSINDLALFHKVLTPSEREFLEKNWPNPLSVILPIPGEEFSYLHRGTHSLSFRMPKDETLRALIKETGPLVAPSANPQGLAPAQTTAEAMNYFGDQIDVYVDGGIKDVLPSTLVSLVNGTVEIIRQGTYTVKSV